MSLRKTNLHSNFSEHTYFLGLLSNGLVMIIAQFKFRVGALQFKCTSYDRFVVAGARTLCEWCNSSYTLAGYRQLLVVADRGLITVSNKDGVFRTKVWNNADGKIAYTNQPDQGDATNRITPVIYDE